jgi:hypothetical protein
MRVLPVLLGLLLIGSPVVTEGVEITPVDLALDAA